MKIGIDASRAFVKQRTGIEEYSFQVISHLREKLKDHQVVLYLRGDRETADSIRNFILPANWKIKKIKMPRLWTQIGLSMEMMLHPVDALFIPAHVVPMIHPKNTVVTVHGLEFEAFPEGYPWLARLYMRWSIKFSCRQAKKIISVSQNTKTDLRRLYHVAEKKIFIVHEGFEDMRGSGDGPKAEYGKYLLFIGRIEKRKNIGGMISAFEILKKEYGVEHKMILVGKPGEGYPDIRHRMESSAWRQDMIELGYVDEEEKKRLLRDADVFLFPTFYEGFGLPILEAQSSGVPVVISNTSSGPEVAGDGAAIVNPRHPDFIAGTVFRLIQDKKLRDDIIRKGHSNLRRFSWNKCADLICGHLTKQ